MLKLVEMSPCAKLSYFPETRLIARLATTMSNAYQSSRPLEEWDGERPRDPMQEDGTIVVLLDKEDIATMYRHFVLGQDK